MKNTLFLFTALAGLLAACSSNTSDKKTGDSSMIAVDTTFSPTNPEPVNSTNCYLWVNKKDSISLKLTQKGEELTGDLKYLWSEKDQNKGTIAGEIKGDTILADYTFDSEGMRSVRQVVFVKKDGKLYEGYGDSEEKGGKTVFKNRAKLKFDDTTILSPVSCK